MAATHEQGYIGKMRLLTVRGLAFYAVCSTSVLSSCNFAEGFQDVGSSVGDPDSALIDAPGRQLAQGRFRKITVDGSLAEGGKVVALSDGDEGTDVVIVPYPDGEPCRISPAIDFDRISSRIDVALPGVFAVQETADTTGRGTINLVNFDCEGVLPSVKDARIPRVLFPSEDPQGMLIINGEGVLSMIKPDAKDLLEIAADVTLARTSQDYVFASRKGKVVVFGKDLEKITEIGENVIDFFPQNGKTVALALLDQNGLSIWNAEDGLIRLSNTACAPTYWGSDTLAYYDPCEERRLQVYVDQAKVGLSGKGPVILDGPSGVATLDRQNLRWASVAGTAELGLLLADQAQLSGALVVATVPADAAVKSSHVALDVQQLSEGNTTFLGTEILTEYDGQSGTLVLVERDDEGKPTGLAPLAKKVTRLFGGTVYSDRGILNNFDGTVGDLVVLNADSSEPEELLSGVPNQVIEVEPETGRFAILGRSKDGHIGSLYLSANDAGPLKEIGKEVLLNSARFMEQPRGVAYLSGEGSEPTAKLKAYLIDSGLTVTIHSGVDEYRTLPWPSPGILYSVPSGEDQGLWYAKAR